MALVYKIYWCDGIVCYKVPQLFLAPKSVTQIVKHIEKSMSSEKALAAHDPSEQALKNLAEELGACMKAKGVKLAAAESCTGGWLAKIITDIPGSSEWFTASVVCYSNESKTSLLGVSAHSLKEFGAVSGETVMAMADGLLTRTDADVVVGVSGIAGPDGGSDDKPVGLVWLSLGKRDQSVYAHPFHFDGNREDVRKQSIAQALNSLLDLLAC